MIDPIKGYCEGCDNLITCTCEIRKNHKKGCRYLIASELSMELACDHGLQACLICDRCDCGSKAKQKEIV